MQACRKDTFNDPYATSVDVMKRLTESNWHVWDRFSRRREFRADVGGAELAGREKMIAALERLKQSYEQPHLPDQLVAFGISGGIGHGLKRLFMSHPSLDERIAALRQSVG